MTIPDGYMQDAKGRLVPRFQVKPQHILEDELVRDLGANAVAIHMSLATLKERALTKSADFLDLLAQEYETTRGGKKGNFTLKTYDGSMEVQVSVSDYLNFGPELKIAKDLIDDCVTTWSEGADDKLRTLIDDAFQVNKTGRIDTHRVLGLRRLNIEDEKWDRAMTAISDALRVDETRTYVRFYRVDPETKARAAIVLDLAGV